MRFSIVIPTWEQYGKGVFFLNQLLTSIRNQNYQSLEVIISDHSINNDIENLTNNFTDLFIRYFRNENNRGNSPANLNFGLNHAEGDIIKVMFQDDFFVNNNSLILIDNAFTNKDAKWLVNGCCHTTDSVNFYNFMVPSWNDRILEGINTISSPSVLSFINSEIIFFDENLTMLMDCDYYTKMKNKFGVPSVLEDITVVNRTWGNRLTDTTPQELKNKEFEMLKLRYA